MVNDDVCTIFWLLFLSWNFLCCPNLNLFLLNRDNYFSQCVTIVGSQFNFFHCPISCLLSSHFTNRRYFHFLQHLQIGLDLVFTTASVETPPSLFELSWSSHWYSEWNLPLVYYYVAKWIFKLCLFEHFGCIT